MKKITLLFYLLFGVVAASYGQYSLCGDAVSITLPFTTTDNTVNYADTNYEGSPGATGCNTTAPYLGGNDVVFLYTATSDSSINIAMTTTGTWSGMFVYNDCASIGTACIGGGSNTGAGGVTISELPVISGQNYYIVISTWPAPQSIPFTLNIVENTCTNATATYAIVSDCINAPQFFVDVNITDLGTATSVTVTDDQGSAAQNATATGIVTFGPFANATPVIFTISNDQDTNCVVTSASQTQAVCPPDCATAPVISACEESTTASLIAGPGAWNVNTCGFATPGVESLYSFTPTVDGVYSLEVTTATGGYIDYYYKDASGTCDNTGWTCIDDNTATGIDPIGTLTAGTTYFILLDSEGTTARSQTFKINCPPTCTDATVTYAIVSDCINAPQFFVDVNITDLGTATSITVSDDQGSAVQNVTAAGIVTFGPFANATPVIFTIANDQDGTCVLTSTAQTQSVCPPDCATATVIAACEDSTTATIAAGNGSWNVNTCGFTTPGIESLYSFTPTVDGVYSLQITAATGGYVDYYYKDASGTCDNTGWTCIDDNNAIGIDPIGTLTAGTTYLILLDSEGTTARTHTFKINCPPTCTNATVTYAVVSDCINAPQFFVDVNITDLGTATSITVSDDQGSAVQNVTTTGIVTFGPFANATPVIFTIANDQDVTCVLTSAAQTQAVCPPDCATATVISACEESTTAAIVAGAGAWNVNSCGFTTPGIESLYSFTPTVDGVYSLEVTAATGGYIDYYYKDASGTCDNTGWTCIDDNFATGIDPIGTLTAGTTYLILLDSEGTTARSQTFKINCPPTCTDATVTYAIVSDCANAPQFFVDVNITDLGTATSITVSDDQGSAVQNVTATGIVTFGPFANATPVIFTIANDQDGTCVLTSTAQTQVACPPANDLCENATPMLITADFATSSIIINTTGATVTASNPLPTCGNVNFATNGKDIWYQSVVPPSGNVTVETQGNGGLTDSVINVYTGSCTALIDAGCDDDGGIGNYSLKSFTGLTPGDPILIRVWGYNGSQGSLLLGCYDSLLASTSFDTSGFVSYPNPVIDVLNLSYSKNIDKVQVINLIGQEVVAKSINATNAKVDMSQLPSGTYLVKITSDNQIKTLKVIKQ